MEWKSQSTDEVGDEYDLSWGPKVGRTCPASSSRCAMSAAKYLAARRFAMCFSLTVEATHLPPAPDMFSCAGKTWAWVLELEGARVGKGGRRRG